MPKKDVHLRVEDVVAHLTWPAKEKDIVVTGTAVHANDGVRIDGINPVRRRAKTAADVEFAQNIVANTLTEQIEAKRRKEASAQYSGTELSGKILMKKIFYELFGPDIDKKRKDNPHRIYPWASSTQHMYVAYFNRNILPQIVKVENTSDFTSVEKEELVNDLADKAKKRMKNIDDTQAQNIAIGHMNAADRIYCEMRYHEPSLPDIDLRCGVKLRRKKTEQLKRLPRKIHKKYHRLLEEAVQENPYMVRSAVMMDSAAARSGEAAATWSGWHDDYGDYMVVRIVAQEEGGKRIDRLKSSDSYRCVVLDEWGTMMIRKCNELIGEELLSDDSPVIDKDLSSWVRMKLREAGCTDDYLREAYADMEQYPEYNADGKPVRDIAAHICRRNRASIWRNYCGYTQDELDYALGHKNSKSRFEKDNPLSRETFEKLAGKNAHYDIDIQISKSPKHHPIEITEQTRELDIPSFDVVRIRNASSNMIIIEVDCLANETGEKIKMKLPRQESAELNQRSKPNGGFRGQTYVIGTLSESDKMYEEEEEYEEE